MMPVLFIGHGHPLNAIRRNEFTTALTRAAGKLPRPEAILVVSAHWLRRNGVAVSATEQPETIYEGFSVRQHQHALLPHRVNFGMRVCG
jgi:4,5-DOPA dioxygenase extradiol